MSEFDVPVFAGLSLKMLIQGWALSLPRLAGAFAVVPILPRAVIPGTLNLSVCAGLAMLAAPVVAGQLDDSMGAGLLIALAVKELLLGVMLGFVLAIPFWALEGAGFLIDNQRGESISATLNPFNGHDTSTLGEFLSMALVVFVMISGSFLMLLRVFYDSLHVWPPHQFWPALTATHETFWLSQLDGMMEATLLFAAPVVFAMLLVELGLALISHFAPQLDVFMLAMPLKSAVALVVLALYAVTLFDFVQQELDRLPGSLPVLSRMLE